MVSYWFRSCLACAEMSVHCMEVMCLWWLPQEPPPPFCGRSVEPWLSQAPWSYRPPARGNCYAAAYAHWALPLARMSAVNDPYWRHSRCDRG
jgi:hypothetical protein